MKQIRSGQPFLYRNAGYDSTVIEVRMVDKVRGACLQVALSETVKRFPYMTDKLVEKDGRFYLAPDVNSMTVNRTHKFRPLGSMTTGYHLLDVTYIDNLIRVAFHHGLCDGGGVKPFVETLLYEYCTQRYHGPFSSDGIRLPGEDIDPDETVEPFGREHFPCKEVKMPELPKEGFPLPESTPAPEGCWRTEFLFDEAGFVAAAKAVKATPSLFAAMVFSDCIRRLYPEAELPVIGNLAIDLRTAVGMEKTHRNCVGSVAFPYGIEDASKERTEVAAYYRELLKLQRDPDLIKTSLNHQIDVFNKLDEMRTLEERKQMLAVFESMVNHTYVISYLGQLRLNDYASHIQSACFYSDTIRGLTVNMLAAGGKLTMEILQGFPGTKYVESFRQAFYGSGLLGVSETQLVTTGGDKSFKTARHQAERYYMKTEG